MVLCVVDCVLPCQNRQGLTPEMKGWTKSATMVAMLLKRCLSSVSCSMNCLLSLCIFCWALLSDIKLLVLCFPDVVVICIAAVNHCIIWSYIPYHDVISVSRIQGCVSFALQVLCFPTSTLSLRYGNHSLSFCYFIVYRNQSLSVRSLAFVINKEPSLSCHLSSTMLLHS